jgi:ribonuclease E
MAGTRAPLIATTTPSVALYILNNKRPFINDMEARLGLQIMVTGSDKLAGANFTIEKGAAPAQAPRRIERTVVNMESGFEGEDENENGEFEAREPVQAREPSSRGAERTDRGGNRGERDREGVEGEEAGSRRRRRRRRGGRGRDREEGNGRFAEDNRGADGSVEDIGGDDEAPNAIQHGGVEEVHEPDSDSEGHEQEAREPRSGEEGERTRERGGRSRRRGRRGGRRGRERNGERGGEAQAQNGGSEPHVGDEQPYYAAEGEAQPRGEAESPRWQPAAEAEFADARADANEVLPAKEVRRPKNEVHPAKEVPAAVAKAEPAAPPAPRRRTGSSEPRLERIVVGQEPGREAVTEDASSSSAPVRKGWWQRKLGGE